MERQKCEECGGKLIKKQVEFVMYGVNLGKFPAEVCSKCGEEMFDEKTSQEIDKIDLDEFIYGDSYGTHNTFLCIYDLSLFSINEKIENIIKLGELNDVALNCIETSKNK